MKRKVLSLFLIAGLLSFGSCVQDDIDGLQDQIDDLNEQIVENEQAQQEALLAQIAELQALIEGLKEENGDLAAEYQQLLQDLLALQQDVEDGQKAVYYGNVITDADFAAVLESGASIVTGKVSVIKQSQLESIVNVKMIGGYLEIIGLDNVSIPNLENISGSLMISGIDVEDATVSFDKLVSVGGDLEIHNNSQLVSVVADELVMVYGKLSCAANTVLTNLSFTKLDLIGELFINEGNIDYDAAGSIADLDLGATDVMNDVYVVGLGLGSQLVLGSTGGDFYCYMSDLETIELRGEVVEGSFTIEKCGALVNIILDNLTHIKGDFALYNNNPSGLGQNAGGLTTLEGFDNLQSIGGDVNLTNNSGFESLVGFNNVTEVLGDKITIKGNGQVKTLVEVFNKLEVVPSSLYEYKLSIEVVEKANWFNSFNKIHRVRDLRLSVYTNQYPDYSKGDRPIVDGFVALTEVKTIFVDANEVGEFSAFELLSTIQGYGTYLEVYYNSVDGPSMCSMSSAFDAALLKANNWNYPHFYDYATYSDVDSAEAVAFLTSDCGGFGI